VVPGVQAVSEPGREHNATADGAIAGSVIVRRITDHKTEARETLVGKVGEFVSELIKPLGK